MPRIAELKCVRRLRESRPLVVLVVFMALMLDVMMMTSVDPILPAMLRKMNEQNHNVSRSSKSSTRSCVCILDPATMDTAGSVTMDTLDQATGDPSPSTPPASANITVRCRCRCKDGGQFEANCDVTEDGCRSADPRHVHVPADGRTDRDVCHKVHSSCSSSYDGEDDDDEEDEDVDGGFAHMKQSTAVGLMVAAKPATELVSNIAVGYLVDRVGHRYPMIIGCLFNFASTVGFAYAGTFWTLLLTRVAQAVGSSLSVVAGLVFLACVYTDDAERAKANSRAFSGISMGVILGYPYGSAVYQFLGRRAPFLILAAATLADGALRMILVAPDQSAKQKEKQTCMSTCKLLSDGYILVGLGSVFLVHFGLGVFLATGPAWMLDALHADQWTIGVVLGVAVIFHITAQIITGIFAVKVGRWLFCMLGMLTFAAGIAAYPLCTSVWMVLGPEVAVRIGHGTVLCVISPLLGHIVDLRHKSHYGTVYGLYTASYNLGISLGSIGGGLASKIWPFERIYWTTAAAIGVYSLTGLVFRNPRPRRPLVALGGVATYGTRQEERAHLPASA